MDHISKELIDHEIKLSTSGYLNLEDVREEIQLLADSMSTHKALAEKIGISPQYLHDILSGNRKPGKRVLAFLNLEDVMLYRERKLSHD